MEQLNIDETEFAKGYDDAFWLIQLEPAIAQELRVEGIDARNDYLVGFKNALDQNKEKTLLKDFQQLREKRNTRDLDR